MPRKPVEPELYQDECEDTQVPLCPYCGEEYHGDPEDGVELVEDEHEEQEITCAECDKEFTLTMRKIYLFTTAPAEGWGKPKSNA